ncbi:uncharacterized protein LTR77_003502 [Saxophila tyrrhenica]|uniref:F-box domain-containing protein n=1 Tax=Saxophila tyrrhenica TaxID=1690608 RepID=A0AAV9PGQ2_9PEZI|nr:hypothetical protein LTR77_003502 [Saxophila tyrrhenica]
MAACTKTLGTYELLEAVLLHLEPLTLLKTKRVCSTWLKLIENSSAITKVAVAQPWTHPEGHQSIYYTEQHLKFHPLLAASFTPWAYNEYSSGFRRTWELNMLSVLVVTPPCTTMHLTFWPSESSGPLVSALSAKGCKVHNEKGVRFQDVHDVLRDITHERGHVDSMLAIRFMDPNDEGGWQLPRYVRILRSVG